MRRATRDRARRRTRYDARSSRDSRRRAALQRARVSQRRKRRHAEERKDRRIDRRPAEARQQLPGEQRAERGTRERGEFAGRLRPRALRRPVRLREQRRAADEHEVPADAQARERGVEMREIGRTQREHAAQRRQRDARTDHRQHAEAPDQPRGKQRRREHADQMPLDDRGAVADAVPARHCGDRRRGHHEHHHGIAERVVRERRREDRLPHDLAQRPRGVVGSGRGGRRRHVAVQQHQQDDRREPESGHERIGARERDGRKPVLAPRGEQRTAHGRDDAAREHRRDRAALAFESDCVGGGQPVVLRERLKHADGRRARAERPEVVMEDRPHGHRAAQRADARAEYEARATADARHQERSEDGRQRGRDRDQRERQCGERLVVGERVADEPGQRQIDRYRRCVQRLANGQHARGAAAVGIGAAQIGGVVGEG